MMAVRSPRFNKHGTIDMEINHPKRGWIPFTAEPTDSSHHSRQLYAEAMAGNFGPIAPYEPPQPEAESE